MKRLIVLLMISGGAYLALRAPAGPRSGRDFDPAHLAQLETELWQAADASEDVRVFSLNVKMLREQYNYPWSKAVRGSVYLTSATASLSGSRGSYEAVLPDLVAAYQLARDWTGAGYDAAAVARAELLWWAARRDPDKNNPDTLSTLITNKYALMYETSPGKVAHAAQLRARAAALRETADEPNWDEIDRLLEESYTQLLAAVAS
jgi:hypothetical protein